jgi:hypothetical protein
MYQTIDYFRFSSSADSAETEVSAFKETTELLSNEIYFNDSLTSDITNLNNESIESLLPTEMSEFDKIIRASK